MNLSITYIINNCLTIENVSNLMFNSIKQISGRLSSLTTIREGLATRPNIGSLSLTSGRVCKDTDENKDKLRKQFLVNLFKLLIYIIL